ncbi:hypothetical protein HAX54_042054, partial [Datura stramonium]|nr:hypothetical protein [Datura stramonium]
AFKLPTRYEELKSIKVIKPQIFDAALDHFLIYKDPLERALVYGEELIKDEDIEECL